MRCRFPGCRGIPIHAAWLCAAFLVAAGAVSCLRQETPAYRDPGLPVGERVSDLLSRMTLEEKTAQLVGMMPMVAPGADPQASLVDREGHFLPEQAAALLGNGLGEIAHASGARDPGEMAAFTNAIQAWVRDNTRLGIPVLFHEECLHGHVARRGTSFPQALALASTWDPELVETVFSAVALEVRSRGAQQCLAPVLDLARDPRWGRTEETYGEDPFLVSRMGVAAVRGFQGPGPGIDGAHVIATAKHFAVHGQPERGTNTAPGNYSERIVREQFLRPFEAAVREGRIQSVMASYNEIDGIPSHANARYLDGILRQEWGFEGLVVSDYNGVRRLRTEHHVAASGQDSARMALEAGVDIELPDGEDYAALAGCDVNLYDDAPEQMAADYSLTYGFVRGSLVNYTRQAAGYLGEHQVRCNCIAFAPAQGSVSQGFADAFTRHAHLKRLTTAADIRGAVVFLASDASAYVTGVTLPVDGGYTAK